MIKPFLEALKYLGSAVWLTSVASGAYLFHLGTTRTKEGWNPSVKERIGIQRKGFFLIILGILVGIGWEVARVAGIF